MTRVDFELDAEILAQVDRLAAWRGMTRDDYIAAAIRHIALHDAEFEAKLQQGIDDIDAGRIISQEEMEARFDARHQQAAAE